MTKSTKYGSPLLMFTMKFITLVVAQMALSLPIADPGMGDSLLKAAMYTAGKAVEVAPRVGKWIWDNPKTSAGIVIAGKVAAVGVAVAGVAAVAHHRPKPKSEPVKVQSEKLQPITVQPLNTQPVMVQ